MGDFILIDGSEGEGGGQMLRSALALSLLTRKPFRAVNIRANRPKPGLAAQHLASVHAAASVGHAVVTGDQRGSREVTFEPGTVQSGQFEFRIETAGATALVLHTVYLPLILRGQGTSSLRIMGGTHVKAAPNFEFLDKVWRSYVGRLGAALTLTLVRKGLYPRGGGEIRVTIEPARRLMALADLGTVDPHSADQLLLPLAFAEGASRYPTSAVTQHLLTNAVVIQRFVNRTIRITGTVGAAGLIEID